MAPKNLLGGEDDAPVVSRVRAAVLLDPDDPLYEVLQGLRRHQHSVGLVRDREGRTLGVLTPEDVFEEVVGELSGAPESTD